VVADRIVQKVPLELSGRIFSTNLIILSGQGIVVIIGMSWMKMHKAVLDIAAQLVHLNSPVYGKATLHLPAISRIKASLHMWFLWIVVLLSPAVLTVVQVFPYL
jgi:hypothetical protein